MRHVPYETRSAPPIEVHNDDVADPIVTATQAVDELRTAVEQHRTATDQRITTELRSITERLDAIDVRTQRPGGTAERPNAEAELQRRAFTGFLRYGPERLAADEARSLIVDRCATAIIRSGRSPTRARTGGRGVEFRDRGGRDRAGVTRGISAIRGAGGFA